MKKRRNKPKIETGHSKTKVIQIDVPNPYYSKDHAESSGNQKLSKANYNLRESPIALYHARSPHVDDAMMMAGTRVRYLWETSQGEGLAAYDYTQIFVDGGQPSDNMSERKQNAIDDLGRIKKLLTDDAYSLIILVCGQGLFVSQVVGPGSRRRDDAMKLLLSTLNILAEEFEYTGRLAWAG